MTSTFNLEISRYADDFCDGFMGEAFAKTYEPRAVVRAKAKMVKILVCERMN